MSHVLTHYEFLHANPEPALQEVKTAAYLQQKLEAAGYTVQAGLGGATGLAAVYDSGVPGPVLGLRADMDSLSHMVDGKKVQRHTCGHDAHMSMLLAAAEEVAAQKLVKKGKIKFIFQPAEEIGCGAKTVIQSGVIEDIDILIGMHVRPITDCPAGKVICGLKYTASCIQRITIQGASAHSAKPHLGINPIDAAVCVISAVNAIHLDPRITYSIKCTQIHADSGAVNGIPSTATLVFDMRTATNEAMDEMKKKFDAAIHHGAAAVGAEITGIETAFETPASVLDPEITQLLADVITDKLGADALIPPSEGGGGEDFFWYTRTYPQLRAGFTGMGAAADPGLHHPDMHLDTTQLEKGVLVHVGTVEKLLG